MPRPRSETPTYSLALRGTSYCVQWWDGERSRRVSCRTEDRGEAERFLANLKAGSGVNLPPASVTIGAILDGYEAARTGKVHSGTLAIACTTLRRHLGPLTAELLTGERVAAYQAARRKEGAGGASAPHRKRPRPLSNGTLIRELGVLRAALTWATNQQPPWIARAPHIEMPEAPGSRERWLTRHEAGRLLDACETLHVKLFVALALHTGHRAGAILGLTWDRVDLTLRLIDLGKGHGKKRRQRHLPINDALLPILVEAKKAATTPWVIEYRGKSVASIKTGFLASVRRAKLRGVTPHVLRHTAVTWMVQMEVPFPMIGHFVGMSVEMIERRYGHASPTWMRQASEALSGGFLSKTDEKTKTPSGQKI